MEQKFKWFLYYTSWCISIASKNIMNITNSEFFSSYTLENWQISYANHYIKQPRRMNKWILNSTVNANVWV